MPSLSTAGRTRSSDRVRPEALEHARDRQTRTKLFNYPSSMHKARDPNQANPGEPLPHGPQRDAELSRLSGRPIEEFEEFIRRQPHETAHVRMPDGSHVLTKDAPGMVLRFTKREIAAMKGAVFTHNHPGGLGYADDDPRSRGKSFSEDDVELAASAAVAEIRAITPNLRFKMAPSEGGWSRDTWEHIIKPEYDRVRARVGLELDRKVSRGKMSLAQADAILLHQVWQRVAKRLGLHYEREEL